MASERMAGPTASAHFFCSALTFKLCSPLAGEFHPTALRCSVTFCFYFFYGAASNTKQFACNAGDLGFHPWVRKMPWRREWLSTLAFLPGESHGQRSLAIYSPKGCKKSDTTERLMHARTHTRYLPHCLEFLFLHIYCLLFY